MFDLGPAILFCPGDRPERYAKAAERADAVIIDLEDAVAPDSKAAARDAMAASSLDPARTIVRVNGTDTGLLADDLAAVRKSPYRILMLAKTESAADVAELTGFDVVALVETAKGVVRAAEIAAAPGVVALMWGAEDLMASMGGSGSRAPDGDYRDVPRQARAQIALAAAANGRAMIDAVHLDIGDLTGLVTEVDDAVACGFAATACIHPDQVWIIRQAYKPRAAEVRHAEELLRAAEQAGRGVFAFEGRMVDAPVLAHARAVLRRAARTAPPAKETP